MCLHRGNSASENLKQETQWQRCCLYETPYIAAPNREQGDVITRTLPYARLPSDAPTRTRFFWFTSNAFLKRPIPLKNWLLGPFSTRKPHAKAYRKRTTLCSQSSTIKGLLYAHDPEKREKGALSDQPRLSRTTSTALLCRWGRCCSKI